jgi:hypothetical protein
VGGPGGTADEGIEDAEVDGDGRVEDADDGPDGGTCATAVHASSTKAALLRHARIRRIAGFEATLRP